MCKKERELIHHSNMDFKCVCNLDIFFANVKRKKKHKCLVQIQIIAQRARFEVSASKKKKKLQENDIVESDRYNAAQFQ